MHARGVVGGRGQVWQGACVVGGMCGRGYVWWGGVHGGGACMTSGCMAGGGMRGRKNGNCSGQYGSYWNAFVLSDFSGQESTKTQLVLIADSAVQSSTRTLFTMLLCSLTHQQCLMHKAHSLIGKPYLAIIPSNIAILGSVFLIPLERIANCTLTTSERVLFYKLL